MPWIFVSMTAAHAKAITTWRYEPPYDFYNPRDDIAGFLRPDYHYYAAQDDDGGLVGYCCFGPDARVPGGAYPEDGSLDVGVGLRPDLTGGGRGLGFFNAVLDPYSDTSAGFASPPMPRTVAIACHRPVSRHNRYRL